MNKKAVKRLSDLDRICHSILNTCTGEDSSYDWSKIDSIMIDKLAFNTEKVVKCKDLSSKVLTEYTSIEILKAISGTEINDEYESVSKNIYIVYGILAVLFNSINYGDSKEEIKLLAKKHKHRIDILDFIQKKPGIRDKQLMNIRCTDGSEGLNRILSEEVRADMDKLEGDRLISYTDIGCCLLVYMTDTGDKVRKYIHRKG